MISILYIGCFFVTYTFLNQRVHKVSGELQTQSKTSGAAFSDSLDLRIARQNNYPSSQLVIVKDYGSIGGISEKLISFKVPVSGLTEYGLMMLPDKEKPPTGFPAIILCHGYSNPGRYKTTTGYLSDMRFYAEHGFAVIKPDYRGQGASINQGRADSAYYSMAYNDDVMSLITSLKQTPFIDRSNINLWGHSMGAYVALRAAIVSGDIKNLILLSGPVDNLYKMYLSYIPPSDENNLNALKTRQDVFNKYGTPAENIAFWRSASPLNFVQFIIAKVQVHVGLLDKVVPPEFSASLDLELKNANITHGYFVYPEGAHSLLNERPAIWDRSLQILKT